MSHWLDRPSYYIGSDPVLSYAAQKGALVSNALETAGIVQPVLSFAIVQAAVESGGFKNNAFLQDNNPTGIMYINKPYQKATKGIARPKTEGGNYAHYANLVDWAIDMKRVLSLTPGTPIKANTIEDYVHRLKLNKYFASNEAHYLADMKRWRLIFQLADPNEGAKPLSAADLQNAKQDTNPWNPANWSWKTWIIGGVATVLVIRATK